MHSLLLTGPAENHSGAQALGAWLRENGWDVRFAGTETRAWSSNLDVDAVVFLISRASAGQEGLRFQLELVLGAGKRVICVAPESLSNDEIAALVPASVVVVRLPIHIDAAAAFPAERLAALKAALESSRLDAHSFDWPPEQEKSRPCYRGLEPLTPADAGVFFGRDRALRESLEALRSLAHGRGSGAFVLTGATGAGKSSFLCAGLLPRLAREGESFCVLPVLRPGRGGFRGAQGLVQAIAVMKGGTSTPQQIAEALAGGVRTLAPLLRGQETPADANTSSSPKLVVTVDQAEMLFRDQTRDEHAKLLLVLKALTDWEDSGVIILYSATAGAFESLQCSALLPAMRTRVFPLPAFSRAELELVISGPLQRSANPYRIDAELVTALLDDAEACANPLPLLAYVLEQLARRSPPNGAISLSDYNSVGRLAACLDAAGDRVLGMGADQPPPPDHDVRLALLRRGLIPWLACIDPQGDAPRRRLAMMREIPVTSLPLIERLEQERLLRRVRDTESPETACELVHDVLLERWSLLRAFLAEEPRLGAVVEGLKRASRNWDRNVRSPDCIAHAGAQLETAEHLYAQPDTLALLDATDRAYLVACRDVKKHERETPAQAPLIEIEPRRAEMFVSKGERTRRPARLAWAGAVVALSIAGVAAWKWQEALQEKSAADARLARTEASIESAIGSSNSLLKDLTQKLSTGNTEQTRLVKDVASRVSDMQLRLDDQDAFSRTLRRTQSVGLNTIAQTLITAMNAPQALSAAQKSVLLMQKLTSLDSNNAGWRRDLSVSYETLGDAQLAVGDVDGALASYRFDLNIAKALASSAPDNPQWRWDVSVSREKLGDAYFAKGEFDKALEAYGETRATREALLNANPSNTRFQRGLAISYERIGSTLAKRLDIPGATASFEGALEIYQKLARANPEDAQALLSTIAPRWRLAELNRPRARDHLNPALEILERLAAQGRLGEDKEQWLVRVRSELAALDQSPIQTP